MSKPDQPTANQAPDTKADNLTPEELRDAHEPRRDFLLKVGLGLGGAAALAVGVPVVSALLAPLLETTPEDWRKVGELSDFAIGSTRLVTFRNAEPVKWSSVSAESAAWLRRDSETHFTAFSVNCSHLGCPVRWEAHAELFMCPCHGGIYYKDGTVAAGPPPHGLTQYRVRVRQAAVELLTAPLPITTITS